MGTMQGLKLKSMNLKRSKVLKQSIKCAIYHDPVLNWNAKKINKIICKEILNNVQQQKGWELISIQDTNNKEVILLTVHST